MRSSALSTGSFVVGPAQERVQSDKIEPSAGFTGRSVARHVLFRQTVKNVKAKKIFPRCLVPTVRFRFKSGPRPRVDLPIRVPRLPELESRHACCSARSNQISGHSFTLCDAKTFARSNAWMARLHVRIAENGRLANGFMNSSGRSWPIGSLSSLASAQWRIRQLVIAHSRLLAGRVSGVSGEAADTGRCCLRCLKGTLF